jgi:hypothetical protein
MVRRLEQLDRADGINLSPRHPQHQPHGRRQAFRPSGPRDWPQRPPRRGTGKGTRSTLLITFLIVGGLVWGTGAWRDVVDFSGSNASVAAAKTWPPPPSDAQASRLLPAVPVTTSGPHAFRHTRPDGTPATYDPCRPLRYVINPAGMPPVGLALIRAAVNEVSATTGLVFTEEGLTDEPLVADRSPLQVDRYGNRWAPVLIGWSRAGEHPHLGGNIAGVGGSAVLGPDGPGSERLISGAVVLDIDSFDRILTRPDGYLQAQSVIMHELGHVVGLGHVSDPGELMYEDNNGRTTWGPGDLQGLAILGAGECHTDT